MGTTVIDAAWGPWPALRIDDGVVAFTVVPDVGGRVVSLVDRRTGREWLTQGEPPNPGTLETWAAEGAVFGGRESFGWDECLPTVTGGPDPLDPAGPRLRDHGDQWGRRCAVRIDPVSGGLATTWDSPRWPMALERRMTPAGDGSIGVDYELASRSDRPLPVLWSAHPALRVEPGTRVGLEGVTSTRVVGVIGLPFEPGEQAPWPCPAPDVDLSRVAPIESRSAVKLYAQTTTARVTTPDGAWLEIVTDGDPVRTMGVWLDAGGWPSEAPIHQVALEPTSSPDDHVADALAERRAWTLPARGRLRWGMRIRMGIRPDRT
jgi:galactose mutarotase-like enzyme